MGDKMQQLIKCLKRVEKDTKIKAAHPDCLSLTQQVEEFYPSLLKLQKEVLLLDPSRVNEKNLDILKTAGFDTTGFSVTTSKGQICI